MKKFLLSIVSLSVLALSLVGCGSSETGTNSTGDDKVIRAAATGQSYPNAYKDGDKLTGFDIDVLETIAKNIGYKVEWTTVDFNGSVGQLDSGKLDTIANEFAVTDKRKEKYNFTDTYFYTGVQIVTSKDNYNINSLSDLYGKTISGVVGSNKIDVTKKYFEGKDVTLRTYETRDGAENDAINKRVDGYVNSSSVLSAEIKKNNLPLKFVGDPINVTEVAFPFAKTENGEKLAKEFNKQLEKMRQDGSLKELSEKYFGDDFTVKK